MYFNIFSTGLSNHNTLTRPSSNLQHSRISDVDTRGGDFQGRGRNRGHVRVRGWGGIHDNGQGIGRVHYETYSPAIKYTQRAVDGTLLISISTCDSEEEYCRMVVWRYITILIYPQ